MIAIEITTPLRFFLRLKTRRRLPEAWNEVPQGRRLSVFGALLKAEGLTGQLEALRLLLRLRKRTWRRISGADKAAMLDAVPWLKAVPSPISIFTVHRSPFTIHSSPTTYRFPDDNFTNGSCMEFALADEFLGEYLAGNEKSLPLLTATLLRELDLNEAEAVKREDLRVTLNGRMEVERRATRLRIADCGLRIWRRGIPQEVHVACLMYFVGVKQLVNRLYGAWLFASPDPSEGGEQDSEPPKGDPLGWWGLYMDSADGDVQKLEAIQLSNFHNFCTMEVRRRKQAKEAEMRSRMNATDFGQT